MGCRDSGCKIRTSQQTGREGPPRRTKLPVPWAVAEDRRRPRVCWEWHSTSPANRAHKRGTCSSWSRIFLRPWSIRPQDHRTLSHEVLFRARCPRPSFPSKEVLALVRPSETYPDDATSPEEDWVANLSVLPKHCPPSVPMLLCVVLRSLPNREKGPPKSSLDTSPSP